MHNKKILILSTGGTIAGKGEDTLNSSKYEAGAIGADTLIESLPPMGVFLCAQEIAQIDSIEMNALIWQKILEILLENEKEFDGFVITHGTDTMEESSFALDLLYQGEKPVVFVGAMRPSNAISSDGIKNLCNAITLASSGKLQGVAVLMNDKIFDPKTIYKSHTYNLDAFKSRNGGEMGYVLDQRVRFFHSPKRHDLGFKHFKTMSQVEIVYIYAGIEDLPKWNHPIKGLVIVGCGAGNIPQVIREKLRELQTQGVQIIACSRGNEGFVLENEFIPSFGLNPPKARILLALCLQSRKTKEEIKDIFSLF